MGLLRRWLVMGVAGVVLSGAAADASLRAVSDDVLARTAAAAVHARVVAASAHWETEADAIYTFVTLDVLRSWGLPGSPARIVVKQLGGIVGTTALVIGGQAKFAVGEEVVLFLDVRPRDHTLSVSGLEQGKWLLTGSPELATAFTREVRGHDQATVVARDYRSFADLEGLAALAGTRVSAAGANVAPVVPSAPAPGFDGRGVDPLYTLLSSTPARWHQADTGTPVYVDTQAGGHPQFPGGGLTQLSNAAAIWRAAGSLSLQNGAARSARCFYNSENDARISVTYGDPCGEIADGSSTLAIGGAYFSSDIRTLNGINYWRIIKGMIVTDNPASKWSGFTTGCYEEVLVHEIGHAIGFGHAAARPAIMYPSISSGCFSRTVSAPLGADDLLGMAALYPGAGIPLPVVPGTPTGLVTSVSGSTVTISWSAPTSGGAPTGYQLIAGTSSGASNIGVVPLAARSLVVPGVPNGVYYVRIVATNAAGASAPTADATVVVGAAPGAPRSLAAAAPSPGFVSLSWLAPSSGPAPTSYLVLAGHAPGASLYQIPVAGTGLAGGGVPAGTYYVRVVALNGTTPGPASAEVVLTVH